MNQWPSSPARRSASAFPVWRGKGHKVRGAGAAIAAAETGNGDVSARFEVEPAYQGAFAAVRPGEHRVGHDLAGQPVDMPVRALGGCEVARDPCTQSARSLRASRVGVERGRQANLSQAAHGAERKGSGKVEQQQVGAGQGGRVRNRVHPARHGRYFMVGMMNSAPVRMPDGQRAVTVLGLVKKRTPSGPCMFESPNSERFQPPKV